MSGGKLGAGSVRTGRADIVQHLVGADLGIDCLDSSSHDELLERDTEKEVAVRLGLGSAGAELVDVEPALTGWSRGHPGQLISLQLEISIILSG